MKISLRSIQGLNKRYGCAQDIAPEGADGLAIKIGAQLGAIEETVLVGAAYQGIIIARVISCIQHPNADRLHVCMIDDDGKAQGVERDANGYVQVVCGAPNVREGLLVAWLPPGSTVPESYGKDAFVLESRELRGVVSNGMLASPRELALGDSHEGILEIDGNVQPGTDFAEQYTLAHDVVFDIENKMFTHRPDCFGFLGVSRELAGIQHMPFRSPDWYRAEIAVPEPNTSTPLLSLEVQNKVPELLPRYTAICMSNVLIRKSPVWLQVELAKHGVRAINNIVDLTNYFMLESGQPLHAYDYDKVKARSGDSGATIVLRHPTAGEKMQLLNGKEIEPRAEAVMIATDRELIAVGGVMGGADTEVDENTKNIIIEVANFDMYSVRRTSMAHGLFTDAVTRFNKGQSPLQTKAVLAKMVDDVSRLAGGAVSSVLIDDNHLAADVMERASLHAPVSLTADFINLRLGLSLTTEAISQLLTNVEFDVTMEGENLTVKAPFWRTDIEIPEDVVEEVGRLYGFDHLPLELPLRPARPVVDNQMFKLKQRIRDSLSTAGANEVLSYSFVHGKLLEKAGQSPADAFKLSNALSPELQYYRLSLTPSLLDKVHSNIKSGHDSFALFEIGKGHNLKHRDDDESLPSEFEMLSLVFSANDKLKLDGAAFYRAKYYLEVLAADLGVMLEFSDVDPTTEYPVSQPYDLSRSAMVSVKGGEQLGMVGELKTAVIRNFKLPKQTAAFDIGLAGLLVASATTANRYVPLSRYPKTEQDISLKVPAALPYRQLFKTLQSSIEANKPSNSRLTVSPLDIYQRPDDPEHKQVSLRISLTSYDKTLRDAEVSALLDQATTAAQSLGAIRL